MTPEDRGKIISNDYINLIVEYNRKDSFMAQFADDPINIIDQKFGVTYLPTTEMSTSVRGENGYAVIPKLYGLMDMANLDAMGVRRVQSVPQLSLSGEGVLLGFVDTGIDYTNLLFKNPDNTTRIVSIWDQGIQNDNAPEELFYFGTEYGREQINEALSSPSPLSVVPSMDETGHGTMLAGIAGGSRDNANNFQGVAPLSEFVIVKLKQAKQNIREHYYIPEGVNCYQGDDILFGIKYLLDVASRLNRPIAICIGLGTNQGGHAGLDVLTDFLTGHGSYTGRAFIIAAGNEGASSGHYFGTINGPMSYNEVELLVGNHENGFEMELWGRAPNTYSIDILSPSGQYIPQITGRLGESREIKFLFENTTVNVDYLLIDPHTGNPLIIIRFDAPAPGLWKFRVYARGSDDLSFHIWLPIRAFIAAGTRFVSPDPDMTITAPGNHAFSTTVTAYNTSSNSIYLNASRGYTVIGAIKPDVAAPGVDVLAPVSGGQYIRASGTSIAAAHALGAAAMVFEWGIVRENYLTISNLQIQRFLIRGAVRYPGLTYPNRIWGYGTINVYNLFLSLSSTME